MAKITSNSYPLDGITASRDILLSIQKNSNNKDILFSYIKNETIPRMNELGIVKFEKTFNGIIKSIDEYISNNKTINKDRPNFIE